MFSACTFGERYLQQHILSINLNVVIYAEFQLRLLVYIFCPAKLRSTGLLL